MLPFNKLYKTRKVSLTIHCKYKYLDSTVQKAEDRRQKFYFCRSPFAVNVKLNLSIVIRYTRPFLRPSSSCEQLLYSRLVEFFSLRLPGHLPADCLDIRLFVFNLLLLSVWCFFIPTFPEEISVLNVFEIKSSHLWPFIPNSCLSFLVLLFSSAN